MTTQDTIISVEEQDVINMEMPNFTSIISNVQPAATFLSFFINFPGEFSPYNAIEVSDVWQNYRCNCVITEQISFLSCDKEYALNTNTHRKSE